MRFRSARFACCRASFAHMLRRSIADALRRRACLLGVRQPLLCSFRAICADMPCAAGSSAPSLLPARHATLHLQLSPRLELSSSLLSCTSSAATHNRNATRSLYSQVPLFSRRCRAMHPSPPPPQALRPRASSNTIATPSSLGAPRAEPERIMHDLVALEAKVPRAPRAAVPSERREVAQPRRGGGRRWGGRGGEGEGARVARGGVGGGGAAGGRGRREGEQGEGGDGELSDGEETHCRTRS